MTRVIIVNAIIQMSVWCAIGGCAHSTTAAVTHMNTKAATPAPDPWATHMSAAHAGVDEAWLDELLQKAKVSHSDAFIVIKDGQEIFAWPPEQAQQPIDMMSATKPFVALATGLLIEEGKLNLNASIATYFPQWRGTPQEAIKIEHLLLHSSGLVSPTPTVPIYESGDFVTFALESELESTPGTQFKYNNNAVNLLAGIISHVAKEPLDQYLARRLFSPMGITTWSWEKDVQGQAHGMAGLHLKASDAAKIGVLLLNRGRWDAQQLIPGEWVDYMFQANPLMPYAGALMWRQEIADAYVFDEQCARSWEAHGAAPETLNAFDAIKDKPYTSTDAYFNALREVIKANPEIREDFVTKIEKPGRSFYTSIRPRPGLLHHQGNVGQYLIVIPEQRTVIIRQLVETDEIQRLTFEENDTSYMYRDLITMSFKLAQSVYSPVSLTPEK